MHQSLPFASQQLTIDHLVYGMVWYGMVQISISARSVNNVNVYVSIFYPPPYTQIGKTKRMNE